MAPRAFLIIRTIVPNQADRAEFDAWYREDHIPAVLRLAGPRRIVRGWNKLDPAEHVAMYGFPSVAAAHQTLGTAGIGTLISDFDGRWDGRTTRSRALIEVTEDIGA